MWIDDLLVFINAHDHQAGLAGWLVHFVICIHPCISAVHVFVFFCSYGLVTLTMTWLMKSIYLGYAADQGCVRLQICTVVLVLVFFFAHMWTHYISG